MSTVGQYYTESLIFDGRNFVIIHSVANSNLIIDPEFVEIFVRTNQS